MTDLRLEAISLTLTLAKVTFWPTNKLGYVADTIQIDYSNYIDFNCIKEK